MAGFFEWKKQLLKMMDQSGKLAASCGYEVSAENIARLRSSLEGRELMVVAAGEARRGKSSLMNMLLNQKEPLFPVDINVCTNVVTVARYARKEKITAVMEQPGPDGDTVQVREEITRSGIGEYVSEQGNPDNYKNVTLLEIELPSDFLKDGVVFVDTPGVGSMNINHAQVTYGFLPNADLLLFIGDTASGFTKTETDFLKKGYEYCKNIVFPLTKKDLNANYQVIADDNRAKIHEATGIPVEDIHVIPVSSTAKQRYLETGRKSMLRSSNFEELERVMWESITAAQADRLLLPFAAAAGAELDRVSEGIAAQYQMLHADKEKSRELVKALAQQKEQLESLQEGSASWKQDLNLWFYTKGNECSSRVQELNFRLQNIMDETVQEKNEAICREENYVQMLTQMNDEISRTVLELKNELEESIAQKIVDVEEQLGLHLDVNREAIEQISFTGDDSLDITFRKKKFGDTLIHKGSAMRSNIMGGSYAGSAIGGVGGAVIGLFFGHPMVGASIGSGLGGSIGTLASAALGTKNALKKFDATDIQSVKKRFNQYISASISRVNKDFSAANQKLKSETMLLLDRELKKKVKEIQENITRTNQNIAASKNSVPEKKKLLQQQNAQLKKAAQQWETAYVKISEQWAAKERRALPAASPGEGTATEEGKEPSKTTGAKTAQVKPEETDNAGVPEVKAKEALSPEESVQEDNAREDEVQAKETLSPKKSAQEDNAREDEVRAKEMGSPVKSAQADNAGASGAQAKEALSNETEKNLSEAQQAKYRIRCTQCGLVSPAGSVRCSCGADLMIYGEIKPKVTYDFL